MTLALRRFEGSYVPPLLWPGYGQTSSTVPFTVTAFYELPPPSPVEDSTAKQLIGKTRPEPEPATRPSATYVHVRRDHVKARLRMLRRLPIDHDREGAAAPDSKSIDTAIAFIDRIAK